MSFRLNYMICSIARSLHEFTALGVSRAQICCAAVGGNRKYRVSDVFLAVSVHYPVFYSLVVFNQLSRDLLAVGGRPVFDRSLRVNKLIEGLASEFIFSSKLGIP